MNIYPDTIPQTGEEFTTLLEQNDIRIVRIVSSDDIEPIMYDQKENEWITVIEGGAILEVDGEEVKLGRGDVLLIPAHTPHTVTSAQKGTLWLAVHFVSQHDG
jgi:cupin 2 domain-containing protein